MANEIANVLSYLNLYSETTWGTTPGSPTYVFCPVLSYDVRLRPERRNSAIYAGIRQRKHSRESRATVSGQIVVPFYGFRPSGQSISLAEYLIGWAFGQHETVNLASKGAEWAEGPNTANKRHTGLRINSATLAGSSDSGQITLTLDVIGVDEASVTTAQTLITDHEQLFEADFADTVASLDDGAGGSLAAVGIKAFEWRVTNNIQPEFVGGRRIALAPAGDRTETLTLTLKKNSATWDANRRDSDEIDYVGRLAMQGLHNGTGASGDYSKLQVDFAKLRYIDHEDDRDRSRFADLPLQFEVLKPDTSTNGSVLTWSEV